jgi:hypothetical protein
MRNKSIYYYDKRLNDFMKSLGYFKIFNGHHYVNILFDDDILLLF